MTSLESRHTSPLLAGFLSPVCLGSLPLVWGSLSPFLEAVGSLLLLLEAVGFLSLFLAVVGLFLEAMGSLPLLFSAAVGSLSILLAAVSSLPLLLATVGLPDKLLRQDHPALTFVNMTTWLLNQHN